MAAESSRALQRLAKLRAHPLFESLLDVLEVDREDWAAIDPGEEAYPGEGKQRSEVYDLLWMLLTGMKYRPRTHLRLVEGKDGNDG